jgi:hypothetical protein
MFYDVDRVDAEKDKDEKQSMQSKNGEPLSTWASIGGVRRCVKEKRAWWNPAPC